MVRRSGHRNAKPIIVLSDDELEDEIVDEIEDETDELVETTEEEIAFRNVPPAKTTTRRVRKESKLYMKKEDQELKIDKPARHSPPSKIPLKRRRTDLIHPHQQWIDKYEPKVASEICINPQKLKQVRDELSLMINGTSSTKLLVLTGPSGSSKSTSIKILANELITRNQVLALDLLAKWIEYFDTAVEGTNQSDQFEEFLNDAKYKIGSNLSVVIIEELPNIFHGGTLAKFRSSIRNWVHSTVNLPPLVLCLTEIEYPGENREYSFNIENNLTIDTLLGRELASSFPVKVIKFNPIATRFLKKTINAVISGEQIFKQIPTTLTNQFLDEMIKIGDIRSMIFNLQMWTNYLQQLDIKKSIETPSDSLIDPNKFTLNYQRENQIGLFHAIGKIIYCSSEFDHLPSHEQDYYSIERVLTTFNSTNFSLLNLSILENYSVYQDGAYPLEVASNIVDDLSINDLFVNFDANKEIGIRSTRINLRSLNGTLGSHKSKIKFPRHFKMVRQYKKTYSQIRNYHKYVDNLQSSFDKLNLVDGYYMPLIYNKKNKTRYRYNRLGGRFHEIYADDELPIIEGDEATGTAEENAYEMDQFQIDVMSNMAETEEREEEEEMSDPISSDEDSDGSDGFLSDEELDNLISQGRI